MKISLKGRYGLEAILDVALHSSEGHTNLKMISIRTGISERYLEQIFFVLRKGGVVDSIRGAQGGYCLSGDPESITVGRVIKILEGSISPVKCVLESGHAECDKEDICVSKYVWKYLYQAIDSAVENISIKDLVDRYLSSRENVDLEYYI